MVVRGDKALILKLLWEELKRRIKKILKKRR